LISPSMNTYDSQVSGADDRRMLELFAAMMLRRF
jgi:hypothetical protein